MRLVVVVLLAMLAAPLACAGSKGAKEKYREAAKADTAASRQGDRT